MTELSKLDSVDNLPKKKFEKEKSTKMNTKTK
jgi:hypothetical protein